MKAMILAEIQNLAQTDSPLVFSDLPVPSPGQGQILVEIKACGVCHTELDEIEGRTPPPHLPVVPGHEAVGTVVELGKGVTRQALGERVGVGWFYSACGRCGYCLKGQENLCPDFKATGRDADGGYAEYLVVPEESAYILPEVFSDIEAAPLLCAGGVGFRSLKLARIANGMCLGLTGFGAAGHLVLQLARYLYPGSKVFVFARSSEQRDLALKLGAVWAGESQERSPELCDAIIDTTPVWNTMVEALANLKPGGRLIINAIRKEDADKNSLLRLDYHSHLWLEKEIKSVANVTRSDIIEFLRLAGQARIKPEVTAYKLQEANKALMELKRGEIHGAKVIKLKE
jgi:propanol-preferring alcohol dehydrogenase